MIYAYPQPGKAKARKLCADFVRGCVLKGGSARVVDDGRVREGEAMLYGIAPGMEPLWAAVQARDYFYADNSFFDETRQVYFRIARNCVQQTWVPLSDGKRFEEIGIPEPQPWRTGGEHIVVCPQSDHFMRAIMGYAGDWLKNALAEINKRTDRPLRARQWNRDKTALAASLPHDLVGAHVLVTHNSAAAVTALLAGVPVICTGPSICAPMSGTMDQIDDPPLPAGRDMWARGLADLQWSREEIQRGVAWDMLTGAFA